MMWWSENSGYGMGWVSWILMALAMIAFWGWSLRPYLLCFVPGAVPAANSVVRMRSIC